MHKKSESYQQTQSEDALLLVNRQGDIVHWNERFAQIWDVENFNDLSALMYQVDNPEQLLTWSFDRRSELFCKDGRIVELQAYDTLNDGQNPLGRVLRFRDITVSHQRTEIRRLCDRAIDASTHGLGVIDSRQEDIPIVYANAALSHITQCPPQDMVGRSMNAFLNKSDENARRHVRRCFEEQVRIDIDFSATFFKRETHWLNLKLSPIPEPDGNAHYFVGILEDITERRIIEEQLVKQATHDNLTNLPNRALLMDRVNQAIKYAEKENRPVAVVFLDLDHFKLLNDSLGHHVGDKVLLAVANRLIVNTRDGDTVCRVSGDEFVIILSHLNSEKEAMEITKRLLSSLHTPFYINQHEVNITASFGISFYPRDGKDYETLLKYSDLSMYYAKDSGRNNCQLFDTRMMEQAHSIVAVEDGLRKAMMKSEFDIAYQPIINLNTRDIQGCEALIRWQNQDLGAVSPDQFIPIAEEIGLISDIGEWLFEQACLECHTWQQDNKQPVTLGYNVSGKQLHSNTLVDRISSIIKEAKISPEHIEIELTESLFIDNIERNLKQLNRLKDLGVRIAIDDFGTGYSSLSYLKRFPIDTLKIDRSFINTIHTDMKNQAIVKAIIQLANSLELRVLAEGVETLEQAEFLLENDCEYCQGFYFHKPMSAGEFKALLR